MSYVAKLLEDAGLEGERVAMYNLSAAMGSQFAEMAAEMTERVRKLGPSKLRG